jgi:tripartite ATP-independent transporter DctM subunit
MATVAMLGRFVFPVMMSRGCDRKLSIGVILGGASLSPIIPPSVLAVLLATIANISVGDLLVAGILPGILMASGFALYAMTTAVLDPAVDGQTRAVQKDEDELSLARAVAQVLPILVVVFLVVGLVVFGIAQPTESAAIGIVGAVIISAVNGTLRSSILAQACLSAVATAATVLIIVSTAKLFSQLLAFTGTTTAFLALVSGMEVNRWVLFGVVMLVVLFACMFLDEVAVMLISVPILTPVVAHLGFDPIWFWMLLLINFTLGGITPPIGYVNFVFKSVAPADCTMEEIMGAAWPIVAVSCGCIVIMCIFPGIVTWIPYGMRSLH